MRRAAVTALFIVGALSGAAPALAASPPALSASPPALSASPPARSARASALIEESTGQQLYGANADAELPIASTTKLMTALLTLEHASLSTQYADPPYHPSAVESQIGLIPGERMTVRDLIIALLVPSADDAAEDLAYNIGQGSVPRFIAMMNARARELGLTHTHYSTPIGLDTPGNYSSAADLVQLARYLLIKYPFFRHVVSLDSAVLHSGEHLRSVINRNDLVGRDPWVNGVKTGHTLAAGDVLVASGTQRGMTLISAVLGTDSESQRDASTLSLLSYGFSNFHMLTPVRAGSVLARPAVRGRPRVYADLVASQTFTHLFARATPVTIGVQAPRQVTGPLPRGTAIGAVLVLADGQTVARIPLVLAGSLPAGDSLTAGGSRSGPATLAILGLCAVLVLALLRTKRRRPRSRRS